MYTSDQWEFQSVRITGTITDYRKVEYAGPPNPEQPHWVIGMNDGTEIITTEPVTIHVRDKMRALRNQEQKKEEEPLIQLGNDVDKDC